MKYFDVAQRSVIIFSFDSSLLLSLLISNLPLHQVDNTLCSFLSSVVRISEKFRKFQVEKAHAQKELQTQRSVRNF